jgi:hypothetical protein
LLPFAAGGTSKLSRFAAAWFVLGATAAHAQDKCAATGTMASEIFALAHCAASYFGDTKSVTLWINDAPIDGAEQGAFQASAYADSTKAGRARTMIIAAFCPGGGKAEASAAAVKSIDLGLSHARSAMAGAQWVLEAPRDFKVETLSGQVRPGGRLAGRIAGSRTSDGRPYAWDLSFDVTLPAGEAASGVVCGK